MINRTKTFRFDRLLVAIGCVCVGMVVSHLRPTIEVPVYASPANTFTTSKTPLKSLDLSAFFASEEGRDILQEVVAEEMKKPTPTSTPTVPEQINAEQKTASANSTYKTVKNTKSAGGSSGSFTQKNYVPNSPLRAVSNTTSYGSSGTKLYYDQTTYKTASAYTPRWTNPGDIVNHMAIDHAVDVTGKTRTELHAEHDAIHDVIGPVASRSFVATQSTVAVPTKTMTQSWSTPTSNNSCPGGVCPTQPRKGLLARMFGK